MAVWPNGSKSVPTVTGEFGPRTPILTPEGWSGAFHSGIDLIWSSQVIHAPVSGTIILSGYNGWAGIEVRLRADNGDVYRMCHNRQTLVSVGQYVVEGQSVAYMGTTGMSVGVHCHYETLPAPRGVAVDPRVHMANVIAASSGSGNTNKKKEDSMPKNSGVYYKRSSDGADVFVIANTGSGFYSERIGILGDRQYQLQLVAAFDLAGAGFFLVSEGDARVIREACEQVRESHRPA